MTITGTTMLPPEPIWCLDRRESAETQYLFWHREFSKVKFRCDVEVLEYEKDPYEDEQYYVDEECYNLRNQTVSHPLVVCATCLCAIAVTVMLPWFLIGS